MFNFFKKKPAAPTVQPASPDLWAIQKAAIQKQKATDPLVALKIGAMEINQRLMNGLKNEKGIHAESFLTALGALAGFACQMSVRGELAKPTPQVASLAVAHGADGKDYFFGDALNKPLAEDTYSVWSLTAGALQASGAPLPDINDIFRHVSATVGGSDFGIPRIPEGHGPGDLPLNYLKVIWPSVFPPITRFCDDPAEWPIPFALAVQEALSLTKETLPPTLAATIVMECAVPMSKVDLPELYRDLPPHRWGMP